MYVDSRAGSNRYIEPLRAAGVQANETTMLAGDFFILGNGPEGPVSVGVEHKQLPDLFSCMRDGRFAEQLRKMRETYDVRWLCVEGTMLHKPGRPLYLRRSGRWQMNPAKITYQEYVGWLSTMAQAGGCLLYRTLDMEETVMWLRGLELWWTAKDWEQHRAHLDVYSPEAIGANPFEEPPLRHKVALKLPRVGTTRALQAAKHFDNTLEMLNAPVEEWEKIPGFGKKIAQAIHDGVRRG